MSETRTLRADEAFPQWDHYEWNHHNGAGEFFSETEDVWGEVIGVDLVCWIDQPTKKDHAGFPGHLLAGEKDLVGNTVGVMYPLPGGLPMPQVEYLD